MSRDMYVAVTKRSTVCYKLAASYMDHGAAILDIALLYLPLPVNLLLWVSAWLGNTLKAGRNKMF